MLDWCSIKLALTAPETSILAAYVQVRSATRHCIGRTHSPSQSQIKAKKSQQHTTCCSDARWQGLKGAARSFGGWCTKHDPTCWLAHVITSGTLLMGHACAAKVAHAGHHAASCRPRAPAPLHAQELLALGSGRCLLISCSAAPMVACPMTQASCGHGRCYSMLHTGKRCRRPWHNRAGLPLALGKSIPTLPGSHTMISGDLEGLGSSMASENPCRSCRFTLDSTTRKRE
jgi:hypothetical protein